MIDLRNVTLVGISSDRVEETCRAMGICRRHCAFGEVVLFSHVNGTIIPRLRTHQDHSNFQMIGLARHQFRTEFILVCEWDGWIVRPEAWTNDFFQFDYVGAPWPSKKAVGNHEGPEWPPGGIVGNSGFNLRSWRMLDAQLEVFGDKAPPGNCDWNFCNIHRDKFLARGIRFADVETGYRFSVELGTDEQRATSFGFHGFHGINEARRP